MNLKIEEYEEEFEEKLKSKIKDLRNNEVEASDSQNGDTPNHYEQLI
jgi:hypothetical protein